MTEAKKILEMIENVTHDDSVQLDEIDACAASYINSGLDLPDNVASSARVNPMHRFTRSRDALKAIRPEGWGVYTNCHDEKNKVIWECRAVLLKDVESEMRPFTSPEFQTEELAELHAIIQAIEWERSH